MAIELLEPITPSEEDRRLARESSRKLEKVAPGQDTWVRVTVNGKGGRETLDLPASALHLLRAILNEMAEGYPVALPSHEREVSTQKAADYLNVSRPYLINLTKKGELPFRRVGSHRRIRMSDLKAYKERVDAARRETLRDLAAEAQDLDMGY